jgi:hypothetical protein
MEEGLDERTQRLLWIFLPLGTLATLITLVGALVLRPKEVVAAPTGFAPYIASDRSFKCDAPQGWETISVDSHAVMGGALFKKGPAKIDITSDLAGSLMGDIAIASDRQAQGMEDMLKGMPNMPGMPEIPAALRKPPVEKLHEAEGKSMKKTYPGYEEQPMQVLKVPAGMGDGRYSEFTVKGTLMSPSQHGYRVTILPTERRLTVLCICPERNWPALKPAFERVITSLGPGGG